MIRKDKGYKLIKNFPLLTFNSRVRFQKKYAKDYDSVGYISEQLGKDLEKLFDDDYEIGIHRTGYSVVNKEYLADVFTNGLINNGDAMQGVMRSNPDESMNIEKTVSFMSNIMLLVWQLKIAYGYKDSQGSFIIKIPKSNLGEKDGEIKPIYFKENEHIRRLLPEFIYGYVPCDGKGNVGKIIKNPNYKEVHDYEITDLIYEYSVLGKLAESRRK